MSGGFVGATRGGREPRAARREWVSFLESVVVQLIDRSGFALAAGLLLLIAVAVGCEPDMPIARPPATGPTNISDSSLQGGEIGPRVPAATTNADSNTTANANNNAAAGTDNNTSGDNAAATPNNSTPADNAAAPDSAVNLTGGAAANATNPPATLDPPHLDADGYRVLRFEELTTWRFLQHTFAEINSQPELGKLHNPLPDRIRALDGTRISVPGYPLPQDGEDPAACRRFILCHLSVRCCFGRPPEQHDFLYCTMEGDKTAQLVFDGWPSRARGVLHTRIEYDEEGYPVSVYKMTVHDVTPVPR